MNVYVQMQRKVEKIEEKQMRKIEVFSKNLKNWNLVKMYGEKIGIIWKKTNFFFLLIFVSNSEKKRIFH